jgi:regulatory protein
MPTVTLLQLQERHRDRVNVHLDGEYALSLCLDVAIALRRGQELTDEEVARLAADDAYRRGLDRALRFLAHRPRSRQEVSRHLASADVSPTAAARVTERLTALGLVDDLAFARWWVDNRSTHQPRGRLALRHELATHGVAREDIDAAMSDLDEEALALDAARPHLGRLAGLDRSAFNRKLGGILARRGFAPDTVRDALDSAWRAARDEDADA